MILAFEHTWLLTRLGVLFVMPAYNNNCVKVTLIIKPFHTTLVLHTLDGRVALNNSYMHAPWSLRIL